MGIEIGKAYVTVGANLSGLPSSLDKARSMTEESLSKINHSREWEKVKEQAASMLEKEKFDKKMDQWVKDAEKEEEEVGALDDAFGDLKGTIVKLATGFFSFKTAWDMLKESIKDKQIVVSLEAIAGSARNAANVFEKLDNFGEGLFDIGEISHVYKGMLLITESATEAEHMLSMMGDAATMSGMGLGSLASSLEMVYTTGHLTNEQLRTLSRNGIISLQDLMKYFGKTKGEMQELVSKGYVRFEDLQAIMMELTSSGGRFADGMEKMADVDPITKLTEAWGDFKDLMAETVVPVMVEFLSQALTGVNELINYVSTVKNSIKDFADVLKNAAVAPIAAATGDEERGNYERARTEMSHYYSEALEKGKKIKEAFSMDGSAMLPLPIRAAMTMGRKLKEAFGGAGESKEDTRERLKREKQIAEEGKRTAARVRAETDALTIGRENALLERQVEIMEKSRDVTRQAMLWAEQQREKGIGVDPSGLDRRIKALKDQVAVSFKDTQHDTEERIKLMQEYQGVMRQVMLEELEWKLKGKDVNDEDRKNIEKNIRDRAKVDFGDSLQDIQERLKISKEYGVALRDVMMQVYEWRKKGAEITPQEEEELKRIKSEQAGVNYSDNLKMRREELLIMRSYKGVQREVMLQMQKLRDSGRRGDLTKEYEETMSQIKGEADFQFGESIEQMEEKLAIMVAYRDEQRQAMLEALEWKKKGRELDPYEKKQLEDRIKLQKGVGQRDAVEDEFRTRREQLDRFEKELDVAMQAGLDPKLAGAAYLRKIEQLRGSKGQAQQVSIRDAGAAVAQLLFQRKDPSLDLLRQGNINTARLGNTMEEVKEELKNQGLL